MSGQKPAVVSVAPRASVVIPVYNTPAGPLDRCMKSVLAQTEPSIEVIIVDDGSNTSCAASLTGYAIADERVRVVSGTHRGPSAARNSGLMQAQAPWVTFVDSDDEVAPFMVEEGLAIAERDGVDLVIGRREHVVRADESAPAFARGEVHCLDEPGDIALFRKQLLARVPVVGAPQLLEAFSGNPFARFFKTSVAVEILFREGLHQCEDTLFNVDYLARCRKVALCGSLWYRYYIYSDSLARTVDLYVWRGSMTYVSCMEVEPALANARLSLVYIMARDVASAALGARGYMRARADIVTLWAEVGLDEVCTGLDTNEFLLGRNAKLVIRLIGRGYFSLALLLITAKRLLMQLRQGVPHRMLRGGGSP